MGHSRTLLAAIVLGMALPAVAFAENLAPPTPPLASSGAAVESARGMVRDGSSFVFASPPVTTATQTAGQQKGDSLPAPTAKARMTAQQKALLARVSADIHAMKRAHAREIRQATPVAATVPQGRAAAEARQTVVGAAPAPVKRAQASSPAALPAAVPSTTNSVAPPAIPQFSERPPVAADTPSPSLAPPVMPRVHAVRPAFAPSVVPLPQGTVAVSTGDYNIFAFPVPLREAILPPGAPVAGKPVYLSGGRILMLRFYPDGRMPVQLVAELDDAAVVTLTLVPESSLVGQRINVRVPMPVSASLHEHRSDPNARFVPYLAKLVMRPTVCPRHVRSWNSRRSLHGDRRVPVCWARRLSGFSKTALPAERIYNRVLARPVDAATNGNVVIYTYVLTSRHHDRSVVDPGQFSWSGVRAALLTGGLVGPHHSPVLYIVMRHAGN